MSITYIPMSAFDTEDLVSFLTQNRFPFHVQTAPRAAEIRKRIEAGRFWNEDTQGFWVVNEGKRIGMVALDDLQDDSPFFGLRLDESQRGPRRWRGRPTSVLWFRFRVDAGHASIRGTNERRRYRHAQDLPSFGLPQGSPLSMGKTSRVRFWSRGRVGF